MTSKKQITVDDEHLILASHQEYEDYLQDGGVKFLKDSNGRRIGRFESLIPGGSYRLGPPVQAALAPVSLNL